MMQEEPCTGTVTKILQSKDFTKLSRFYDEAAWQKMDLDDQKLLVDFFVAASERVRTEEVFEKTFRVVETLAKDNPFVWHRVAKAVEPHHFEKAVIAFEEAIKVDPTFFQGYISWAGCVLRRAKETGAEHLFSKAEAIFNEALRFQDFAYDTHSIAALYHKKGLSRCILGKLSGEASDFHESISSYVRAEGLGLATGEFFYDYGKSLFRLGQLINNEQCITQATVFFQKSIEKKYEKKVNSLTSLAKCYKVLFERRRERPFFQKAHEAYADAHALQALPVNIYEEWAKMLFAGALLWDDVSALELSIQKYTECLKVGNAQPSYVAGLVQAIALLGSWKEDMSYISHAEELITLYEKEFHGAEELLFSEVVCLYEKAYYFEEPLLFVEALAKIEQTKGLSNRDPEYTYLLAKIMTGYGSLAQDEECCEQAILHFEQIMPFFEEDPCFYYTFARSLLECSTCVRSIELIEDAIELFEELLEMQKELPLKWIYDYSTALIILGNALDEEFCYSKAIDILEYALLAYPNDVDLRGKLAFCYSRAAELLDDIDDFDTALSLFEEVVAADPEDESAYNEMGLIYMHFAEFPLKEFFDEPREAFLKKAEEALLKAQVLGSTNALYNLACLYSLQDNLEKSLTYLKKAYKEELFSSVGEFLDDPWLEKLVKCPEAVRFFQEVQEDRLQY